MPYPVAASRNRNFGVPSFAGAYDAVPSIVAAYGMRRLRAAYSGSILRIRRSSDNAEQDIGYTGAGDLDTAAVATFVGGGSGYIVNWYDQSGNAYTATQTTAASQPLYVASGQNGRPVLRWDGVNDYLINVTVSATQPYSLMIVAGPDVDRMRFHHLLRSNSGATGGLWRIEETTGYQFSYANPGIFTSIAADGWHVRSFKMSGGTSEIWLDGVSRATGNAGTGNLSGITIGIPDPTNTLLGDTAEIIICNAALSDANRQAAEAAANNYWGVY